MKKEVSLTKILFNFCLFLCVYYIGFTFIVASFDKIVDPYEFSKNISAYEITPYWINNFVALILPWIELICGILIFFGLIQFFKYNSNFIDVPNNLIIIMLLWFIFILSIASIRGLDIDCGCGLDEKTTPYDRLIEDIYLFIVTIIIKFRVRILDFLDKRY
tara:strand:- start:1264 stop:1746 length:483 start_codon:yes stop_codon:yes gene_type:complete